MNRTELEIYWTYYLSLESMFKKTNQFISVSKDNKDSYSNEFAKIIVLCCTEIDSLLSKICDKNNVQKNGKYYAMKDYSEYIKKYNDKNYFLSSFSTYYNSSYQEELLVAKPFEKLDESKLYSNLEWWKAYQKLKHDRIENYKFATLENAFNCIVAHYIIVRDAMSYLGINDGKDYVLEKYKSDYLIPCV